MVLPVQVECALSCLPSRCKPIRWLLSFPILISDFSNHSKVRSEVESALLFRFFHSFDPLASNVLAKFFWRSGPHVTLIEEDLGLSNFLVTCLSDDTADAMDALLGSDVDVTVLFLE